MSQGPEPLSKLPWRVDGEYIYDDNSQQMGKSGQRYTYEPIDFNELHMIVHRVNHWDELRGQITTLKDKIDVLEDAAVKLESRLEAVRDPALLYEALRDTGLVEDAHRLLADYDTWLRVKRLAGLL
jgi:hypothetical protein